jgi:hypothetical protein
LRRVKTISGALADNRPSSPFAMDLTREANFPRLNGNAAKMPGNSFAPANRAMVNRFAMVLTRAWKVKAGLPGYWRSIYNTISASGMIQIFI